MSSEQKEKGALRWFAGKFFLHPASWFAMLAALLSGIAASGADIPLGGAIGGGLVVGFGAGGLLFLIFEGIKASYRNAMKKERSSLESEEIQARLAALQEAGHEDSADLLESLLGEAKALEQLVSKQPENADAVHTSVLVQAIVIAAFGEVEEYEDLRKRVEDPILDTPEGAEGRVEEIRERWTEAYRAAADARSRLRKGLSLDESDYASAGVATESDLQSLTERLARETEIGQRVRERLRSTEEGELEPHPRSRIVFDEEPEADCEAESENQ